MSLEVHGKIQNVSGFSVTVLVERQSRTDRVRNQREMETETEMGGERVREDEMCNWLMKKRF